MRRLLLRCKPMIADTRGAILVVMTVVVLVLTLLFAGLVEYGRYLLAYEELQTATDAAALVAAGSSAERQVKIEVTTDRGEYRYCRRKCSGSGENRRCRTVCSCRACSPRTVTKVVTGSQRELVEQGGWRAYCVDSCGSGCAGATCSHKIVDQWVTYDEPKMWATAKEVFRLNLPKQAKDAQIMDIRIYDDPMADRPFYPSAVVHARARMDSLLANEANGLFGFRPFPHEYQVDSCGQGLTFYRDFRTGKFIEAPEDACRVE